MSRKWSQHSAGSGVSTGGEGAGHGRSPLPSGGKRLPLVTSGQGAVPLGRGLGHPGSQSRPPVASTQPAPPRVIGWILVDLRPPRSALGSPSGPHLAGGGHSPAPPPPPPCACPARPSANSGQGLSSSRGQGVGGAGVRSGPISGGRPALLTNQRLPALGGP